MNWIKNAFGLVTGSVGNMFSLSMPVKLTMVIGSISAVFFGIGYALRPVAEIVDELHDSDSDSDSDSTDGEREEPAELKEKLLGAVEILVEDMKDMGSRN